jgi:EpsI family protein
MTSRTLLSPQAGAAVVMALAGAIVFQYFGNAGRGYIDTASLFYWWGFQWFNPGSETEHGPMILGLSAWLFWRNLRNADFGLRNAEYFNPQSTFRSPQWPAAAAAALGLALHALGYAVEQARISIVALLVFTWGVLALAGGRRWGRAALFPLAFLVFAIPVNALDSIGFHLRLWVIDAVHTLAPLVGIEVIRNGTQLFSPDGTYQYDVAAACSGVRSLMALMALSLLTAYLNLQSGWRRTAVFLLCFPLTYVGNVVRIGAIVVAGEVFGQGAGEWLHEWAGFVVFVIVLGGILAAVTLWQKWSPEKGHARLETSPVLPAATVVSPEGTERGEQRGTASAWRLAGAVVVLAVLTAWFTHRVDQWPVLGGAGITLAEDGINPADLPAFLGTEWIGQRTAITAIEREVLPPDTGFARRNYVSTQNRQDQVFISIVLSGRDRTSIHRPELCLVGQGWTIGGRSVETFTRPDGAPLRASVLQITREIVDPQGKRQVLPALFVYWFVGRDEVVATHGQRLWRTALNRLRGRTDRWAYVVAQTMVLDGEEPARARLQEVLTQTLPAIQPGM